MKYRMYDQDGYKLRAGCLCYRDKTEREVLLVSGSADPSSWKVPAGGLEDGENPVEAAIRETFEEAGVTGEIGNCLGLFQSEKSKSRTYIFPMFVTKINKPVENKSSKWFAMNDAHLTLTRRPTQQQYITAALQRKLFVNELKTNSYMPVFKNQNKAI